MLNSLNNPSVFYESDSSDTARYEKFDAEVRAAILARADRERDLRSAVRHGELTVFYQPKINALLQQVVGMEALVRWISDEETIPPKEFIPLAEESDVILEIGHFVMKETCYQTAAWTRAGIPGLQAAVNLSARELENRSLPYQVEAIIGETRVDAHQLCFEITEGMMMENPTVSINVLCALKELGCTIAVDDFGTGYSSLSYLQKFPLDVLKIDQSFVRTLTTDTGSRTIVSAVVRLAQTLGLKVVAEGVETDEHAHELKHLACDELQGYLYSQPLPADLFEDWLKARLSVATVLSV